MLNTIRILSILVLTVLVATACDAREEAEAQASAVAEQKLIELRTTLLGDPQEAGAFLRDPGAYLEDYDLLVGAGELERIRGVIDTHADERDIAALESGARFYPLWLRELIKAIMEMMAELLS